MAELAKQSACPDAFSTNLTRSKYPETNLTFTIPIHPLTTTAKRKKGEKRRKEREGKKKPPPKFPRKNEK
jgi:hypothetical protein